MAFAVRPAAHVYGDGDDAWVAGAVFDMHAHHGARAAHALRTQADFIYALFEQLFG